MNWLSWLDPKNAWITAETVRALTRSSMLIFSGSVLIDIRSLTRRAMRDRPTENWLAMSSPTVRIAAVAEVVDVVGEAAPLVQIDEVAG